MWDNSVGLTLAKDLDSDEVCGLLVSAGGLGAAGGRQFMVKMPISRSILYFAQKCLDCVRKFKQRIENSSYYPKPACIDVSECFELHQKKIPKRKKMIKSFQSKNLAAQLLAALDRVDNFCKW